MILFWYLLFFTYHLFFTLEKNVVWRGVGSRTVVRAAGAIGPSPGRGGVIRVPLATGIVSAAAISGPCEHLDLKTAR